MTDMRATERLLEVIEMVALDRQRAGAGPADDDLGQILEAVRELRRRGDTLVRSRDLQLIAAAAQHGRKHGPLGTTDYTAFDQALERIENALGGRLQ